MFFKKILRFGKEMKVVSITGFVGIFLLGGLILGTLITPSFLETVRAVDDNCFEFEGKSKAFVGDFVNEGALDFDTDMVDENKACVRKRANRDQKELILNGWVWNTNLGWVSLGAYAPKDYPSIKTELGEFPSGETPNFAVVKKNTGIDAGRINYSSMVVIEEEALGGVSGVLKGYWWGDSLGWIRLNCGKYYDSDVDTCGARNFKIEFAEDDRHNGYYNLTGYAWSENLGWINMRGVSIDLDSAVGIQEVEMKFAIEAVDKDGVKLEDGVIPYSDNNQGYKIGMGFFVGNDNVTEEYAELIRNSGWELCVVFHDQRRWDDVSPEPVEGNDADYKTCGEGNDLNRDFFELDESDFTYTNGGANYLLQGGESSYLESTNQIVSKIPSDNAAQFKIEAVKITDKGGAEVKRFKVNKGLIFKIPVNLKFVTVEAGKTFDDYDDCMKFDGEGAGLSYDVQTKVYLCSEVLSANNVWVNIKMLQKKPFKESDYRYKGILAGSENSAGMKFVKEDGGLATNIGFDIENGSVSRFFIESDSLDQPDLEGIELELSSIIRDGGVWRFGPTLDLSGSESIKVNTVRGVGGVNDRAFSQLGTASSSLTKANIKASFRKSIVTEFKRNSGEVKDCTKKKDRQTELCLNLFLKISNAETLLLSNGSDNRRLINYDVLKDYFTNMNDNPKTLVLSGFDVYFGKDILESEDILESRESFPALVLLQNPEGVGGNVYVGAEVTELKGYIFAEGSIFSVEDYYVAKTEFNNYGQPNPDYTRTKSSFYNQIAFIGRFYSQNCLGCSELNPPLKGDGTLATWHDAKKEAEFYDFNHFRYATFVVRKQQSESEDGDGVEVYLDCDENPTNFKVSEYDENEFICWKERNNAEWSPYLEKLRVAYKTKIAGERGGENVSKADFIKPGTDEEFRPVNFVFRPTKTIPIFKDF